MIRYMLAFGMCVVGLSAAMLGQVDDFEDGTTMGWFVPSPDHPNPPENVATGGPGGAGDNYLRLTATGGQGAGSRLAVLSGPQWTGNYLTAGIGAIAMSVNNFGPDELHLRLLVQAFPDQPNVPPDHLALSKDAVVIAAGSGWTNVVFQLNADALISGGFGTVSGALAGVDVIRIFHNIAPTFPGPGAGPAAVNAVLGVDNIAAVPEPSTWLLAATGAAALVLKRARRR